MSLDKENIYYFNGTAYAGKSTMVKRLAEKYDGIACEENYHDELLETLDKDEYPCLTYTRDLQDWHPRKKLLAVIKNRKMCQNDKNPSTEDSAIQQKTELADGGSLKTVVINMFKHLRKT